MTKSELIKALERFDDNQLVMILDGFNGGGAPRELNLGPTLRTIHPDDADDTADTEDLAGQTVIVIGYGCY